MFASTLPGNNEWIALQSGQGGQKPLGGGVEVDRLRSCLAVRQVEPAPLQMSMRSALHASSTALSGFRLISLRCPTSLLATVAIAAVACPAAPAAQAALKSRHDATHGDRALDRVLDHGPTTRRSANRSCS